ncbi:MAG: hypothetical protein PW845_11645 [Pseudomonas sp.]|uniref:hypothetical protein n=1 Tax=Pseudomonas abieticivorans TaxID=2931382 RepID=UPI0020C18350|nr:hypothetical protein [Pseudomonas sp. PIA16]MDE1166019.1 hypothetical protein [Pseudomonas sp.]
MRIDGISSHSYPIKRKPRKGRAVVDDNVEDVEGEFEVQPQASVNTRSAGASGAPLSNVPARQQDMIFPRSVSKRVATALSSYLTTASFVEWDMEVLGLDLHI